ASRALCLADQLPAQLGEAEGDGERNEATLPGEVPKPLFDPGPIRQDGYPRAAPARLGEGELRGHPPPLTRGGRLAVLLLVDGRQVDGTGSVGRDGAGLRGWSGGRNVTCGDCLGRRRNRSRHPLLWRFDACHAPERLARVAEVLRDPRRRSVR